MRTGIECYCNNVSTESRICRYTLSILENVRRQGRKCGQGASSPVTRDRAQKFRNFLCSVTRRLVGGRIRLWGIGTVTSPERRRAKRPEERRCCPQESG